LLIFLAVHEILLNVGTLIVVSNAVFRLSIASLRSYKGSIFAVCGDSVEQIAYHTIGSM